VTGQRKWINLWARTVGMPIGETDEDIPKNQPIPQKDVRKALVFRTFWIVLHIVTCVAIIGNAIRHW
tara:strand:- start:14482 stop:14682 length:201 start_codon:yes stop_codon:yes gene_type:complete